MLVGYNYRSKPLKLLSHFLSCLIPFVFLNLSSPVLAETSEGIVVNEVACKDSVDWVEVFVLEEGDYKGLRIYEGRSTLVKELPQITASKGDYIILHFDGDPVLDESDITGKGENDYWDIYTTDSGLTGTDGILRLQKPETVSVSMENTLDVLIWSNNDGNFTSSKTTANELVTAGLWNSADFSVSDAGAWIDSDEIAEGQSIGRQSQLDDSSEQSIDTDSAEDWFRFGYSTMGGPNVLITPTPTLIPTAIPTQIPTPTLTPTSTSDVNKKTSDVISPTSDVLIDFEIPAQVVANEPFMITGKISNASASSELLLKFEASVNGEDWYEGKTSGEDDKYLAWNASWSKFPRVTTNESGNESGEVSFDITAKIREDSGAGDYQVRIKAKSEVDDKTYLSGVKELLVVEAVSTPTSSPTPAPSIQSETDQSDQVLSDAILTSDLSSEALAKEDVANKQTLPSFAETMEGKNVLLITDVREKKKGEWVKVEGVVTAAPELLGSRVMYIEDETGGIKILLDSKNRDDLQYGDRVEVIGQVSESFNEIYIKVAEDAYISVLGEGDLPDPLRVETGAIDEDAEGRLVVVNGQVVATAGNTFYLDDGSGEVKVYIKDSTGINKPVMRKGYYSRIIGINSQYKDEYRILPRFQEDLIVSKEPIEEDVLGALTTELPETGHSAKDIGLILIWLGFVLRKLSYVRCRDP